MHAVVQSRGRSPKPVNGQTTTHLKPGSDSVQNSVIPFPAQIKGKKRERGDQGFEPIKRERHLKTDGGDSYHFRQESILKFEISKLTEKGGLIDSEGVEKLVKLMQPDRAEKKIDLVGRLMLADVISATDQFECLGQFVQLRGLSIFDEWLQEVHKVKICDGSSPKESDKFVEEFLLALLRALDKLPVDLHALKTCNVGKSVNHLRSHKNLEIQKKARSLVDTWKKRVEAEMEIIDVKSGSSQAVSWPSRPGFSDVSHAGSRRMIVSSEGPMKNMITQPSIDKASPVKLGHGDGASKLTSASPGYIMISSSASVAISSKDSHGEMTVSSGTSDMPQTMEEEKSSSSSQSQNNSQSCSSDHIKFRGSVWKQDARNSTGGLQNVNKTSSGVSRHRRSSNGIMGSTISGVHKEIALEKSSPLNKIATSGKVSQSGLTYEGTSDMPTIDHVNSHRLIVRLPNPCRSPAGSGSGGSFDDPSVIVSRALSPGLSENHSQYDKEVKENSDSHRLDITRDANTESWQSNDLKDGFTGSVEGDGSPAVTVLDEEHCRSGGEIGIPMESSRTTCSSSGNDKVVFSIEPKPVKLFDTPLSSITALIESCVKHSAADACMIPGDDLGMHLLASVAAGEVLESDLVSTNGSPEKNSPVPEDSYTGNDLKSRLSFLDVTARRKVQSDDGAGRDAENLGNIIGPSQITDELPYITNMSGDNNSTTSFSEDKLTANHSEKFHTSGVDLQQSKDPCSKSDVNPDEIIGVSVIVSSASINEEGAEGGEATQHCEKRKMGITDSKKVDQENEDKKIVCADEKTAVSMVDGCNIDIVPSNLKDEKEAVEESLLDPLLEMDGENKKRVHDVLSDATLTEKKVPPSSVNHTKSVEESGGNAVLASGSDRILNSDSVVELISEEAVGVEAKIHTEQREIKKMEHACNFSPTLNEGVGGSVGSVVSEHVNGDVMVKSERIEAFEDHSGVDADVTEECASTAEASSLPVVSGLDIATKLDFDLNEDLSVDEENTAPGCSSDVHMPSPLPLPVSSMSSGLPVSITVAAAAKGPFFPLESLLKSKGELRWKGSAATSAFHPAEPRKVLEMSVNTTDIPNPDTIASKQVCTPLDIDLNVLDDRVHEDTVSHCSGEETSSQFGFINYCDLGCSEMITSVPAQVRSTAGLDLDLNRVDEDTDIEQLSASNICRSEVPLLPVRLSSSGGFPNGKANISRDFDLNNGPGPGEIGTEPIQHSQHEKSSMPSLLPASGLRLKNTELGSLSSWFPIGNSYPATAIRSIFPERGEQPDPIVASTGLHRILGPPNGGMTFSHDIYRGPVLSSSPAVAFSPAAPFPYSGFPFSSSFPIALTSFSGGPVSYIDASSGGGLCFPAVPSQLVGSASAVSSHYPRSYVISIPDGSTNGGVESSRKQGRQGLDLNSGPGGSDIDGRHFSVGSPHTLLEEQVRMHQASSGALKRRESEGAWDGKSFNYKQPSW